MRIFAIRTYAIAAALVVLSAWSMQSEAAEPAENEDKLPEIIVTAQKREENLQDVGTSLTAIDANSLRSMGMTDPTAIAGQVPGMQFNQFGATVTIYNLRGVSQNDFSDHQEAPVAAYADDAYIASTGALAGSLFDIDRVEVLRGPQGTLFGRNATGGLIHYLSRKPSDQEEGYFDISAGNYKTINTEGAINHVISDTVSARLSFATANHEGYVDNLIGHRINDQKQYSGRLQFLIKPTDQAEFLIKIHGVTNDNETAGNYSWEASTPDATDGTFRGVFVPGGSDFSGYTKPNLDPFTQSEDRRGIFNRTVFGSTIHGTFKFGNGITLTSVTDYLKVQKRYGEDSDISPFPLFNYDVFYHYHQFSQEFRLNGSSGGFRWVGGAYYLNYRSFDIGTTALPPPFGNGAAAFTTKNSSPSVFAQVEYDFLPKWTVIAGARYTNDDKHFDYDYVCQLCPQTISYNSSTFPDAHKKFDIGTGKIEVNFHPIDGTMLYVSVNRGAKGGGWSAPTSGFVDPTTLPYKAETLKSYELGLKSTFLNGAARLNAATFYYDYKNYQGFFLDVATQVVENVNAKVKGGELEFAVVPLHGLNLQLGVSHLETAVDNVPTPGGVFITAVMPQAPRWSVNAVVRYEMALAGGTASVEADTKWNAEQYLELINAQVDREPAYALSNARLGYTTGDGKWDVSAYVRNLANKYYRVYNLDLSGFIGSNQSVYGAPRTYGVGLRYNWGR
jgi:iron complex outermembrane recepter protein